MDLSKIDLTNAPETQQIINKIIEIIEYSLEDKILDMKLNNYTQYADHMFEKVEFQDFINKYFSLFTLLVDKTLPPIELLYLILSKKAELESGKITQKGADDSISDFVGNKFIYSKYGGKDNFEKQLKKNLKKK